MPVSSSEVESQISIQDATWRSCFPRAAFLAAIGILEYVIYFHDLNHFFQGDTVFWLYYRARSLQEFLLPFISMDKGGWYRPIGNQLLPFVFFPWFGMQPAGYRIVLFILFFIYTVAVFALMRRLTRSTVATYVATLFFATHTIHTITTYDAAFAPEALYPLFYICSVIAYLRFIETNRKRLLVVSVCCFVAGLFSKESAVTMPIVLVVVGFLMTTGDSIWKRTAGALSGVRWHFLVMILYLGFAVGHLHIGGVTVQKLLNPPQKSIGPGYDIVFGPSVLQNADYAFTWAFNIPRGTVAQWRNAPEWSVVFFKGFRLAIVLLAVSVLFGRRRNLLLLGLAWFLIGAFPALLLRDHFVPYYLSLPMVGFSLVVGVAIDWLHENLRRFNALAACVVCFVPLAILPFASAISIWNEATENELLGRSSRMAGNSVSDLKDVLPHLQPNSTIYIINDAEPDLAWDHALGGLFKLYHTDESLHFQYSTQGEKILPDEKNALMVFKLESGHLRDVTDTFHKHPLQFIHYLAEYAEGPYKIEVGPANVVAGKDSYVLTIAGLADADVNIHYVLNNGPIEMFAAHLDSEGRARFQVQSSTRKGLYQFIGFSVQPSTQTIRSDASIIVE